MTCEKTESEEVFESYLSDRGLNWERIDAAESKTPDYVVMHDHRKIIFEVKEFNEPGAVSSGNPATPIRRKLIAAAKQLKEYRDECCAVVLWNSRSIYRCVQPEIVCSAAFGEQFISVPKVDEDLVGLEAQRWKFRGSAALTRIHNTRISAIVILTKFRVDRLWLRAWRELRARKEGGEEIGTEDQFEVINNLAPKINRRYAFKDTTRCIVIENPYARVAFPPELLAGPFDQRWRMVDGWFTVVNFGAALQRLAGIDVPFHCL